MENFGVSFFSFVALKEKGLWTKIMAREEKEYRRVEKMKKEKDIIGLGKWLKKFSMGDFLAKPKREKLRKDDWL